MDDKRLKIAVKALEDVSGWGFGWDGDCGVTRCADEALSAIEAIAPPVAAGSVDTEALRNLALAATRGEWRHTRQGVIVAGPFRQYTNGSAQSQIASFCVTSHEEDDEHQTEKQVPNALFAAAACPDIVLALIDRAEKAEGRVKELEAELTAMKSSVGPIHCTAVNTTYPVSEDFRYKILSDHRRMEMPDGFGPIDPSDIPC